MTALPERDALPPLPLRTCLLEVAVEVARRCGRLVADERPDRLGVADTKSSVTDVVTIMDRRSELLAHDILGARRPDDGIVGEEGLDREGTTGVTWLVDPIDGTVNYLYDLDEYAVSVAAVVGDARTEGGFRPFVGAVYQPVTDDLYVGVAGAGARHLAAGAERPLTASPADRLATSLVGTGFSYEPATRSWQADIASRVIPAARDIRRHGVASLDLCAVARGRLDAYYEFGLHPWDYAAGWVIAEEAGVTVRGAAGEAVGRLIMAGRPEVLDELEALF